MHVCSCMPVISACIACICPQGHGKHHPLPQNTFSWHSTRRGPLTAPCHVPIHFIPLSQSHPPSGPRSILCSPRATCVLGPFPFPLGSLGSAPCQLCARLSWHKTCHSRSGAPHPAVLCSSSPSKTPPDRDWLLFGRRSPPHRQNTHTSFIDELNTFSEPLTPRVPLRAYQGMCPCAHPLYSAIQVPPKAPIIARSMRPGPHSLSSTDPVWLSSRMPATIEFSIT